MPTPLAIQIVAGAEPFARDGDGSTGRVGVLVSHGFTGTPQSMRGWAEHLADLGYTVRLPRLPGHGTTWQEMNNTRWTDWYGEIRRAYAELSARCDTIFLCGLSMGGTLVTKLAEDIADDPKLAGVVLVNPSYGTVRRDAQFAKYVAWALKSQSGIGSDIKKPGTAELSYDRTPLKAFVSLQALWKVTLAGLQKITVPILFLHSTEDHVVEPLSGELLHTGATSTTVTEIPLENSYHVATMDNDAELIYTQSADFISANLERIRL